jgi:surfactin synthase thioesterase subunit
MRPEIFVFGSNEAGIHGAGAARYAFMHCGAIAGKGEGIQGVSYGIPTKDKRIKSLTVNKIAYYVDRFIKFAEAHPEADFKVTQIGCGLAGYSAFEIAPLFQAAPDNCYFDTKWRTYLPHHAFWGTG